MTSRWRQAARQVITAELKRCDDEGISDKKVLRRRLSAVYPFGPRKYHPYKIWLEEVKAHLFFPRTTTKSVRNFWIDER